MFYNKTETEIYNELKTTNQGLTNKDVALRLKQYGKNVIPKKQKESVISIFLNEFKDPVVILLLFAILASIIAGEIIDAIAIMVILLIDAIMGTYQENKANNTAEALEKLVSVKTKVIREDKMSNIDASLITIGDIVMLESGDKISADLRILEAHNLTIDESILTGESMQVSKNSNPITQENVSLSEQSNMAFAGTTVVSGRARAVVVSVGINTEIGKIADSINKTIEEKSPLTIRVEKLSKQISLLVIVVAVIITVLLISKNVPYHEIFLSVIALAVSAMPEGLPLALTMALTIASNKMTKKNVIVKKLNSAESLGSCTVIASDKTGTLTVNEQTAKKIWLPNNEIYNISGTGFSFAGEVTGYDLNHAKEIAYLGAINNEAVVTETKKVGDSIDIAFLVLGKKLGVQTHDAKILEMIPYESENKYSAVFYERNGEIYCTVKGSLEVIKKFCKKANLINTKINSQELEKQNEELASDGYRVIAIANGKIKKQENYTIEDIKNLTFMGMVGFIDPIRKEALKSIQDCYRAGIKVLMITGDHPLTALSIAKELKIANSIEDVANGEELDKYYKKGSKYFDAFIKHKTVFARVSPLQKLWIVESLKKQGEFVAVTGDGVNDAPALKSANIGVAMGSGTDIARETADMIIIDDNFKSIVAGIKEGRIAYANIRKIIYFLISCGLAEVIFFCLSILMNLPMPMIAIQLLWINVVTDGIQDFALSFEKGEENILDENPRKPDESIFNKSLLKEILMAGLTTGFIVFIVWLTLINVLKMDVNIARSYIMTLMVFIQNIHVFNCRSEKRSAFSVSIKNNPLIVCGVVCSLLLQIIVMKISGLAKFLQIVALPTRHIIILLLISTSVLFIMEAYKIATSINKNKS